MVIQIMSGRPGTEEVFVLLWDPPEAGPETRLHKRTQKLFRKHCGSDRGGGQGDGEGEEPFLTEFPLLVELG